MKYRNTESKSINRWRSYFHEDPNAAIDSVLRDRIFLGPFNTLQPAEALRQIIPDEELNDLDTAVSWWLEQAKEMLEAGNPHKDCVRALVQALRTIYLIGLPESKSWCMKNADSLRELMSGIDFGAGYRPAVELEIVLRQEK